MSDEAERRRRIRALRAKAESTTFPAEAEALRAKADELAEGLPAAPEARWEKIAGFRLVRDHNGNLWMDPGSPQNFGITVTGLTDVRIDGNTFIDGGSGIRFSYTPPPQS